MEGEGAEPEPELEPAPGVDDAEDDAQNMMKMLELSEKLVSKELDIMDSMERKFVREGRIKKNGNERVMLLFSDLLVLAKESTKKGQAMYDVRRVIPLQAARLRSHRHHPKAGSKALGFDVMAPEPGGKRYTADFAASSDEERESWLAALKAQVMAQLQRAELRDSFEGEPVCGYGQHHQLCDGTLAQAALAGDADTVRRLREHDGDEFGHLVGEQDEFGATPLAIAAFAGEVEVLDLMLTAEGVKPRLRSLGAERDSDGLTLLCRAAARGHSDVIGVLAQATDLVEGLHVVDGGDASTPVFDLNRTDARGTSPLEHAVQHQHDLAAHALVEAGAAVDSADAEGKTGLMRACTIGRIADVRRWLELGASVEIQCAAGLAALHYAAGASEGLQRQCVAALLMAGARPNAKNRQGRTALAIAMEAGNSAAADSLVERGAHSDDAAHAAAKERWAAAKLGDEDPQPTRRKEPEVSWMPDDASSSCTLCMEEFTLFNRRHHCRSCGTLVCYYCSTHSGPLDIVATADGPELVEMERRTDERLCDGCFNYRSFFQYEEPAPPSSGRLSRTFSAGSDGGGSTGGGTGGGAALPAVVQTSGDREQLLGDARLGGGAERADGGGPASAAAAASEARDQLRANVERAEELAKKTEEMADNASDFADMARKIREKSERSNSWF